jgi:APA family basic amino acid/polyamine antiporter
MPQPAATTLERTLGLRDLILLIIGTVIGSGIFIVPGAVLRQTKGSITLAMLVWLAGGILSLLGALTYGELSALNPKAGGLYVFIRDGFGKLPAFLYGWTLFFVISSGSMATLAVAFSSYLGELIRLSPIVAKLCAIAMIVVVTIINVIGTRKSANLQDWTTTIKVAAILVMCVVLLLLGHGFAAAAPAAAPPVAVKSLLSGVGLAMIGVLWAYEGWQYVTFSAGEAIDAQRNFPRALLIGSAALIGIYLLANLAYLAALGPVDAARSDSIAATAVTAVAGSSAAKLVAVAILISIFSATNGLTLTAPRVYFAMARDELFFHQLAEVHPRFRTPAFAVIAGSAWAIVLAATGTFEQLLTYVVFTGWLFYALGAASIFVYRRNAAMGEAHYRVPGYPLTPLLFILAAAALVVNTIITQVGPAAKGLGIVILGVPAYYLWSLRRRR